MGAGHLLREAVLLAAGDEMVDEDAQPAVRARLELAHHRHHVVEAVHGFHDDAQLAQVVAPYVLHQFGIVLALYPYATGCSKACPLRRRSLHRAAGGDLRAGADRPRRRPGERDRLAIDEEAARFVGEFACAAVAVAQGDGAGVGRDHVATEAAGAILHDETWCRRHDAVLRPLTGLVEIVEDVAAVAHGASTVGAAAIRLRSWR